MIELTGKTALVTGASRGIGRAAALSFARAGCNVVLGYRQDETAARNVVEDIRVAGRHAIAVAGDVRERDTFERLFSEGKEVFGKIDIVVGNAGIWKKTPVDEMSDADWQETIDVNLTSIFLTCQFAAREMKPRRSGKIVLISSTAGQRGEALYSAYAASKGGIQALTKSLAVELGPWNIQVNCVAAGWVDTDMSRSVLTDPVFQQQVEEEIPLKRIATPEQIAGAILFLASDLASHVQGEILNVNGGSVLCG